jgi:hypothetical protein
MKDEIRNIVNVYVNAFDSFPCSDETISAAVEDFKNSVIALGEHSTGIQSFMSDFDTEGYMKTYLDLMGRIALANAPKLTKEELTRRQQITPHDFAEQYRSAWEPIHQSGYRKKAEAAYQRLFDLGNRAADMLDFNVECETGNWYFRLSADDAIEQYEFLREATDPLNKMIYPQYDKYINAWNEAKSEAEISHNMDIATAQEEQRKRCETQRLTIITAIALAAVEYTKTRMQMRRFGRNDKQKAQKFLTGFITIRRRIKRLIHFLLPAFGLSWQQVLDDRYYRHLLLAPSFLDQTMRFAYCQSPDNINTIANIVEEALSDASDTVLLLKHEKTFLHIDLDDTADRVRKQYQRKADEEDSRLTYYKYVKSATNK